MTRKILGVLLGTMLMGGVVAPAAFADHDGTKPPTTGHEDPPALPSAITTVKAECDVQGTVHVDDVNGTGGVEAIGGNHNHYSFVETSINCTSTGLGDQNLTDSYSVTASGGTDGYGVDANGNLVHGESDACGWSTSTNSISVAGDTNGKTASGDVHFIRKGTVVYAWGTLDWDGAGKKTDRFQTVLNFTPTDPPGSKVQNATLTGLAIVGN